MPRPADNTIWSCPDMTDPGYPDLWCYGMNMWLSTWNATNPDRMFTVGPPQTMVLLADGPGNYCSVLPSNQAYSPVARHNGYVNLCFLDGHVASLPGSYVGCGVGIPTLPDVRWIVPNSVWQGP
jgi:prepilin-type processing-associated H-X9-DG protein